MSRVLQIELLGVRNEARVEVVAGGRHDDVDQRPLGTRERDRAAAEGTESDECSLTRTAKRAQNLRLWGDN